MTTRRGFLWLCGASGTGIFLAQTGLIELPKRMVLQLAGRCSFCGKGRPEVFGLAGVVGREQRICDECISICFEILAEELADQEKARLAVAAPARSRLGMEDEELEALLRSVGTNSNGDPREIVERIQARLEPPPTHRGRPAPVRDFHCTFCDRSRHDVRKLVSGPRVFICDDCAGDAGGLFGASGWRWGRGV